MNRQNTEREVKTAIDFFTRQTKPLYDALKKLAETQPYKILVTENQVKIIHEDTLEMKMIKIQIESLKKEMEKNIGNGTVL